MTPPTRQQMDQAKSALKAEVDQVVQTVNDLRQKLASGNQITQQDLDDLGADLAELQGTNPQPQPQPNPTPQP